MKMDLKFKWNSRKKAPFGKSVHLIALIESDTKSYNLEKHPNLPGECFHDVRVTDHDAVVIADGVLREVNWQEFLSHQIPDRDHYVLIERDGKTVIRSVK